MIFAVTMVAFVALSFAGNVYSASSVFKPRTFKMKSWTQGRKTRKFKSTASANFLTNRRFNPSRRSLEKTTSRLGRKLESAAKFSALRNTNTWTQNRERSIKGNAPGNKSRFNKIKIQTRYLSERNSLNYRF